MNITIQIVVGVALGIVLGVILLRTLPDLVIGTRRLLSAFWLVGRPLLIVAGFSLTGFIICIVVLGFTRLVFVSAGLGDDYARWLAIVTSAALGIFGALSLMRSQQLTR